MHRHILVVSILPQLKQD